MSLVEIQLLVVLALTAVIFVVRVRTGHPPRWMREWQRRQTRLPLTPAHLVTLVVVGALPWLVYVIIRPHLGSDATALTIASAIPVVWAVVHWVRRRRIDLAGLLVVAAYGVAVAMSAVFENAAMPLKLRDAGVLAAVGLVCVGSVVVRRPLLLTALRYVVRHRGGQGGALAVRLDDPARRGDWTAATTLAGATFLVAALAEVLLMVTASTAVFLAVAGPLGGLTPLAAVAVVVAFLRHRSWTA